MVLATHVPPGRRGLPAHLTGAGHAEAAPRTARADRLVLVRLLRGDSDFAPQADLAVVDADVESARGIAADPCLVGDGRTVAPIVRQREQHSVLALATLGKIDLHPLHVPPESA